MAQRKSKNPIVSIMAGGVAGGMEAGATWPMETIKTKLQLQANAASLAPGEVRYRGVVHCGMHTVRTGGLISLYRGLAVTVLGAIPKASVRFGTFTACKNIIVGDSQSTPFKNLAAGMLAGALEAVLVVTPMETMKVQLIQGDRGLVSGLKELVAKNGIGSIYQGVVPTIMKQASNQGVRFLVYNEIKDAWTAANGGPLNAFQVLASGMMTGCVSTLANNPIDVVKTRMQAEDAKTKYKGSADCAMKMLRNEGPLSFYRGVGPRMGRVVPGQGIIFLCYERLTTVLEDILGSG